MVTYCKTAVPLVLTKKFTPPRRKAVIHYISNGKSLFEQYGNVSGALISDHKQNLMLMQPHPTLQSIKINNEICMISLYMDLDFFCNKIGNGVESLPSNFKKALYKNGCSSNDLLWNKNSCHSFTNWISLIGKKNNTEFLNEEWLLESIQQVMKASECDS